MRIPQLTRCLVAAFTLANVFPTQALIHQGHSPGEKHIGKPQEFPFAELFRELVLVLNEKMYDFDSIIWQIYSPSPQNSRAGWTSRAVTTTLTAYEKYFLMAATKAETSLQPKILAEMNITEGAAGEHVFLPLRMLGMKMAQVTVQLMPAVDAMLGTSAASEVEKLNMLARTECTLRAALRVLAPLLEQPPPRPGVRKRMHDSPPEQDETGTEAEAEAENHNENEDLNEDENKNKNENENENEQLDLDRPTSSYLHDVPHSMPFRVARANIEHLRKRLDEEWGRRWSRYRSRRRLVGDTDRDAEWDIGGRGVGGGCLVDAGG